MPEVIVEMGSAVVVNVYSHVTSGCCQPLPNTASYGVHLKGKAYKTGFKAPKRNYLDAESTVNDVLSL